MEEEVANKKGRLIVRNLVFNLNDSHIKKLFEPYGEIVEVNMPINNENSQNKGFAFVQYKTRQEALKAISKLNGTEFKGRTIAVDISVPKAMYKQYEEDTKVQPMEDQPVKDENKQKEVKKDNESSSSSSKPKEEKKPKKKLEKKKERKEKKEMQKELNNKEDTKSNDNKDKGKEKDKKIEKAVKEVKEEKEKKEEKSKENKPKPNKFNDKTTLFVRNIGFDTTEEDFYDYFSSYGEVNYTKLCMNRETGMHKGTGFVQYKEEEHAQRMLDLSKQAESFYDANKAKRGKTAEESMIVKSHCLGELLEELELGGRRLIVMPAVKREDVDKTREEAKTRNKNTGKRNLHLTKEGLTNASDFTHKAILMLNKSIGCGSGRYGEKVEICVRQGGTLEEESKLFRVQH